MPKAKELLPLLEGEYRKAYYEGLICERQGSGVVGGSAAFGSAVKYKRCLFGVRQIRDVAVGHQDRPRNDAVLLSELVAVNIDELALGLLCLVDRELVDRELGH